LLNSEPTVKSNLYQLIILAAAMVCAPRGFADSAPWSLATAPFANWTTLTCSADANSVIAGTSGTLYLSTNSSAAWISVTNVPTGNWICSAISADGSQMIAGQDGGAIYLSHDRGSSWSVAHVPNNFWTSITCSTNGETIIAAALANRLNNQKPGHIYVSRNSGKTWKSLSSLRTHFWLSVASSADGVDLVAVANDGTLHTSKNSGRTWARVAIANQPWFSVASSADGEKLAVVANGGSIYTSSDRGNNWIPATNAPNASWASVASSADGQKIIAAEWGGAVFISTNGGSAWNEKSVPAIFNGVGLWSVACSANGSKLFAAGDGPGGGPLYLSQPLPQLNISGTNHGAAITWPGTAVGFVLQQNSGLISSNWLDTSLSVQSTNGSNQVYDYSGKDMFYRLRFPTGIPPFTRPPTGVPGLR
jgi:photosystem II stability/assembly factor-like uncharacterized protein